MTLPLIHLVAMLGDDATMAAYFEGPCGPMADISTEVGGWERGDEREAV